MAAEQWRQLCYDISRGSKLGLWNVYTLLTVLEAEGLVQRTKEEGLKYPLPIIYSLTDAGRDTALKLRVQ